MSQLKFGSAGVTTREIDTSGPTPATPLGIPAGVVGTSTAGPAFVPLTFGNLSQFYATFGATDGEKFGPLAAAQWMKYAGAVTYLRTLGVGDGTKRNTDGSVTKAGFTVGDKLYNLTTGAPENNPYANLGGPNGRTYFLGCFMSESAGSSYLSAAGLQTNVSSSVVLRGVIMAPSGVILRLSSTLGDNSAPASSFIANEIQSSGSTVGLINVNTGRQFVMLLNGHVGSSRYPNAVTASFDLNDGYFANIFNKDPLKINEAGHYLAAHWDISPALAVVTGSGLVPAASGAGATGMNGFEPSALLVTSSLAYNTANTTVPNYEGYVNRFDRARTPWFVSQKFGGSAKNLFRFHSLSDGANVANKYKFSIENIQPSTDPSTDYGTFDVIIRDINDNDENQIQVGPAFRDLTLNPSSNRYIAKVIGDMNMYYDFDHETRSQKLVVAGNYPNQSLIVRVEVDSGVENGTTPAEALPLGFRGLGHLVTSGSAPMSSFTTNATNPEWNSGTYTKLLVEPPVPFRANVAVGEGITRKPKSSLYWGVQFEQPVSLTRLNENKTKNRSIDSYTLYFPDYRTDVINTFVRDNTGAADTAANGILDSDRFCNNLFTLENVTVVTASGPSAAADPTQWVTASYYRQGNFVADNTNKRRGVDVTKDFAAQANRKYLKFTTVMQGGFDGVNIFDEDSANLTNAAVAADMNSSTRGFTAGPNVSAYRKAIDIMKNTTDVDIKLFAIPGIRVPAITDYAITAVEDRFDALYVMDIEHYDSDSNNISKPSSTTHPSVAATAQGLVDRNINTSFAAAYFPDVVMIDPTTLTNVTAPPSVAVLGAMALNDSIGHPWFAPAGFTRGALDNVTAADINLSKNAMDTLYDAKINPIVAFQGTTANPAVRGGLVVWGQKTLLQAASALDRVNVRRLLIEIRRQVRQISQSIIFEPNREATLARFSALVTPVLQRIQELSGLERFRVIIDASTTTQQDIENNTVRGKIYVQPTKSIEFVSLDFVVTNNISQQV